MEKDIESFDSLARRIRQECKALDDNVTASQEGKVSDAYLAGHFSYVENLFNEFCTMVQETVLQDDVLETIKREVDETYRHVCSLRSEQEPENMQQELISNASAEQHTEMQEEQLRSEEQSVPDEKKEKHRTVRRPQMLTDSQQQIQQTQWEKAVSLGMAPVPGQVITDSQLQDFQLAQEQQEDASASAAENLNRSSDQLQAYREKQQDLAQQESIGNSHIDMSRDIFNRKDSRSSETVSIDEEIEDEGKGYTKANTAADKAFGSFRQRYELNSVSRTYGNLSYIVFSQAAQRAVGKLDNDALQAGLTGVYYLKTAYNAARIPLSQKQTASLQKSAQQFIGKQLTNQRNEVIRQNREVRSQISKLEHQLQDISVQKNPAQIRQAERLKTQITALRSQLPGLQKELRHQEWVRNFQHQRTLDQQLIRELSVKKNHKIPAGSKDLQELSRTILKKRQEKILHKYGKWDRIPTSQIPVRVQQLTDRGTYLKNQLRLLQQKKGLSAQERSQLIKLKQQLADTGKQIGELKGLMHAREDLSYVQEKLSRVLKNAGKKRQRIIWTAYFLRNLALRPVQAGRESNTEWLSKSVSFTTNPRTIRYTKKAVSGTAHVAGKAFQKVAPTADNWIRYQVSQKKTAVRKTVKSVKHGIKKSIPTGAKTAAHKASAPIRGVQKIGTGIHNRVYAAKRWLANTRMGVWLQKQKHIVNGIGHAMKGVGLVVKGISLKLLLIFAVVFLVAGVIASIGSLIAGSASSIMILSPHSSDSTDSSSSGKIDLSPYTQIVRSEISAFNDLIDGLRSEYEGNSDYDNVDVQFSGVSNNLREILSMMAVRMKQDLDTAANPNIDPYLRYLAQCSHTYGISEHHYSCSGCESREVVVNKTDPETGKPVQETVTEWYCPGHVDITLSVNVLSFEQMMAQDSFVIEGDDWEGWNEENRAWCKTIYEMDWTELYTGFSISHNTAVETVISPEDELRIWNTIMTMTKNNPFGTAGLMGNLYAESGLNSINLENSYEEQLGYDDASYTQAVDSGSYGNFTDDWAGYGLAQWTDSGRKAELLTHAHSTGVSIGDLGMQLEFLQIELSGTSTLTILQNASTVKEASDEVLVNFERPADQSDSVKLTRASFGEYFFNKYQLGVPSEGQLTQKQIDVIKVATNSNLYGIPADKGYCQAWAAQVYGAAGLEVDDSASAYQSGIRFGVSDDWSAVPPGAAVYGYAGNQYGHVGIYVGNGLVYHNIGGVAVDTLEDWIRIYDGFCWGWQAGEDLTVP